VFFFTPSYNSFLCDEQIKIRKAERDNLVNVTFVPYDEYEFFKIHVPFDSEKIAASYAKLMDMCTFRKF
jgi:hypothetical protein